MWAWQLTIKCHWKLRRLHTHQCTDRCHARRLLHASPHFWTQASARHSLPAHAPLKRSSTFKTRMTQCATCLADEVPANGWTGLLCPFPHVSEQCLMHSRGSSSNCLRCCPIPYTACTPASSVECAPRLYIPWVCKVRVCPTSPGLVGHTHALHTQGM